MWSPIGDSIAFFDLQGGVVDLRLARLSGSGPKWTVKETINLTENSGLDGASHPSWYVPPDQLPTPPPTPVPTPSGVASGGSSSSP